jgi:hypothetical protein
MGNAGQLRLVGTNDASPAGPLLSFPPTDRSISHFSERAHVPLATDEDQNWLSGFLCFVRLELVEMFRASQEDVRSRNSSKKVFHGQVGVRCRFCAHLPLSSRATRSSSYPSSLSRIYQSLTMMLRDHFGKCDAMPDPLKERFQTLKGKTSQGATDSKHYWVYSAMKLGLVDSQHGILISEIPQAVLAIPPFGGSRQPEPVSGSVNPVLLVTPTDNSLVSKFLYTLMTQVQGVRMEQSEQTGNRKNLPIGLPGIGCRHCCQSNRKGLCRFFPVRRRTLPTKIFDLYEHIRRCTLCPQEIKDHLEFLQQSYSPYSESKNPGEKEFYDRIWVRIGHKRGYSLLMKEG